MSLFFKYNVAEVSGIKPNLSGDMINSIDLWNLILSGRAPWNKENKPCGIVETVIGKLSNAIGEELDVYSDNDELDEVLKKLNENSKEIIQNIIALGGCVVRPIYSNGKIKYEIVRLGSYIPTGYDLDGTLTGCVITKKLTEGNKEFLFIEKHEFKNKAHRVEVELYTIKGDSLNKTSLEACSYTAGLDSSYVWAGVEKPFIVEFRNRTPNKIDGSNVPCALWQNTENIIEDADKQYRRINWEQEGGEMRVFADEDLFRPRQNKKGETIGQRLTPELNKLVVQLSGNGTSEEKITEHAPALRTAQQVEAFNQILRRAELAWNVGKGTISDLESVTQTATQYTGGKRDLYCLVDTIESELEEKYRHLAHVFAYMIAAYENKPFNDNLEITYNDTIRKDPDSMRLAALSELQNDIISVAEYRERIFGEDAETAAANVPAPNASNDIGGFFNTME